jgi:hypothetical protein
MLPENIHTALSMSLVVPVLAVFLGAGSVAAADQSPAAHHFRSTHYRYPSAHYRHPGELRRAICGYAPACGLNDLNYGLPGGHPESDYFKVGNGDHGNDGGNGL